MSIQTLTRAFLLLGSAILIGCGASHEERRAMTSDAQTRHARPDPVNDDSATAQKPTLAAAEPAKTTKSAQPAEPAQPTKPADQSADAEKKPPAKILPFSLHNHGIVQTSTLTLPPQVRSSRNRDPYAVAPLSEHEQAFINEIVARTNAFRKENNLRPLTYDATLSAYAQVRAREIITHYEHVRPDGTPIDSSTDGYGWWGENLYASPKTAQAAFSGWLKSDRHRENILKKEYSRIGVGFVYDPRTKYRYYWTQIFASDGRKSRYYFAPANPSSVAKKPQIEKYLPAFIKLSANENIHLIGGQEIESSENGASAAYSAGELDHPIFKRARRYLHNGFIATIQDPRESGFSYQTFGEITNADGVPVQYVNIGKITIPQDNNHFSATYRGVAFGNLNQQSHVYADVFAQLRFQKTKTLAVRFENSKIARDDIRKKAPQPLTLAPRLDFQDVLRWNDHQGRFDGNDMHAYFFGRQGEEIGGQFQRQLSDDTYSGIFVLKKQQLK